MTVADMKDVPPMFASFNDYSEWVRPQLKSAFKMHLTGLLGGIILRDGVSFEAALVGGKMIRGCLLCLISQCLGGVLEAAIPRAIAVELLQAASLLHDDFVDQDTVRRNQPATWTQEGAGRAVLLGDLIFASAIKMMNDLGREDGLILSDAIAQVARGAIQEPISPSAFSAAIASNHIDDGLYERIIHLKTGNLFGAACRLGAIAAGADEDLKERSGRYGFRVGEAYQIADDLQEVKQHLKGRSIDARQMALLAPASLYFVKDIRPHLLSCLRAEHNDLSDQLMKCFGIAAERMKDEIERRMQSAVSEIKTSFPRNQFSLLIQRAPWDLIRMFNEVEQQ